MTTRAVHCKLAHYDVYIGRPSIFGNPFSHKKGTRAEFIVATVKEAVQKYREYVLARPELIEKIKKECAGKVLGCWCKIKSTNLCHGDVIAEICDGKEEI